MAAASPALSNNSPVANSPNVSAASAAATIPMTNSSRNLRGLNKPKCIQCGNVARSRCPYQSCKSCCAKAQNPCHIHVLKNSSIPDKAPTADSATFDQKLTEASPSGSSHRLTSLRQLSNNFAQFNNLQSPLRSRKPLTRKDAANINEWRFKRLKEFNEQNMEMENKAFDRYMHNVCLLEEVFSVNSKLQTPPSRDRTSPLSNPAIASEDKEISDSWLVLKLRSDTIRTENFRKRLRDIVDDGLRKLKKVESDNDGKSPDEPIKNTKEKSLWGERSSAFNDLLDKLSKARNNEDLKSCLELKNELFNHKTKSAQSETEGKEKIPEQENEPSSPGLQATYNPPKWFCKANIDQDDVNSLNLQFSSLESIGN